MASASDKQTFVYVTYIRTTPEKLWNALTDSDLIRQYWFGRLKTCDWKVGSMLESRSPEGELEWQGRVLRSEQPRVLSYEFHSVGSDEPATTVTLTIETLGAKSGPQGESVQLTVVHEGFPARSADFPQISKGWPAIMSGLKTMLETGEPLGIGWRFD